MELKRGQLGYQFKYSPSHTEWFELHHDGDKSIRRVTLFNCILQHYFPSILFLNFTIRFHTVMSASVERWHFYGFNVSGMERCEPKDRRYCIDFKLWCICSLIHGYRVPNHIELRTLIVLSSTASLSKTFQAHPFIVWKRDNFGSSVAPTQYV